MINSFLLGNWKKLWNMKVTIIPVVIGGFGTVTKGLVQGLRGLRNKRTSGDNSNHSITWDQSEYWEESWRLETCYHSDSSERPFANANVKNSQGVKIIMELTAGDKSLAEVKTQRGIFQEDALSRLLFVIARMPLNHQRIQTY